MKKSIWIFLLAVLVPGAVLGWLALRSAEEQQIIFERRTAELYQKETETLAAIVRDAVEGERRAFGDTVHRLLANGDPEALARDFSNTLADAWPRHAIGFALGRDGKMLSPTVASAAANPDWRGFLVDNGSFLSGSEPATVYAVQVDGKQGNYGLNNRAKLVAALPQIVQIEDPRPKNDWAVRLATGAISAQEPLLRKSPDNLKAATRGIGDLDGGGLRNREPPAAATDKLAKAGAGELSLELHPAAPAPAPAKPATDARKSGAALNFETTAGVAGGLGGTASAPSAPPAPLPARGNGANAWSASAPAADAPVSSPMIRLEARGAAAPKPNAGAATKELKEVPEPGDRALRRMDEALEKEKMSEVFKLGRPMSSLAPSELPAPSAGQQIEVLKAIEADALRIPTKTQERQTAVLKDGETDPQKQPAPEVKTDEFAKLAPNRLVEPQQLLGAPGNALSMVIPSTCEFRSLTEGSDEGMVSRFVQDKLDLIFWVRPPEAPEMVFGCLVEAANLSELWTTALDTQGTTSRGSYGDSGGQPQYVMALLDDRGRPAATRPASSRVQDWKRPFVASEIGESLPHWEAALYLASPTALAEAARGLTRTLTFTIVGAVALIALGGWLVVADARRQLALAQQKTDFVSNVSHELKTPLTSIRMFAELMHDRPPPPEKQSQYLRIITVEAERLTRLINNVLDFARIGRKQKRFEKKALDLHEVVSRVWESQGLHLREAGFTTCWGAAPGPYPVLGDDDALAQVLVNLLSNAEKYSNGNKEVELHTWLDDGWVNVSVLDRGMGVPNGEEKKIFEAFYRAHDSLNSGIQGSGLGLTLAHHVAREHGGEIRFEHRDGGGSRFTLRLPLAAESEGWKVEGGK